MKYRTNVYVDRALARSARDRGLNFSEILEMSLKQILELPEDGLSKVEAEIRKCETRVAALRTVRDKLFEKKLREERDRSDLGARLVPYLDFYLKNVERWRREDPEREKAWIKESADKLGVSAEELFERLGAGSKPTEK